MVQVIVLGLGVPAVLGLTILGWRKLSLHKRELSIQEQQLVLEAERLKLDRLQLENRNFDRNFSELEH
jgi:hypothetical protein